ncbi:MAG TPA: DUF2264 domain-containing protein [Tepidisphaeraceae bacterium]|nr:DUF2264 domain-containing protein [Tepidisphaeraceae bacterium]
MTDRAYWVDVATRLATPVLEALAARELRRRMPVECRPGHEGDRRQFSHLEAIARLLSGIAPWLELGPGDDAEGKLRSRLGDLARGAIVAGTDRASPDFLNFTRGHQPIVDAAFLAQALLRAPTELWARLEGRTKQNVVAALKLTRTRKPYFSNWLLFAATCEAMLCKAGEADWDPMRVDYAVRQHEQWYLGDGAYGDGPHFRWDYYNSFVIQPMLLDVLAAVRGRSDDWREFEPRILARARRYAGVQERMISPEGTIPPIGRSLAYRFGCLQSLAQVALLRQLPDGVAPAQVRSAMTAVLRRFMEAPGTFDAGGWLTIGFAGHQPQVGETYISTGSAYLCAAGLLPLGLPPTDPFWSDPPQRWTSAKLYAGEDVPADKAAD